MPPKRIQVQPARRQGQPDGYVSSIYQALTSEDNASVVISVAMFGVSCIWLGLDLLRVVHNLLDTVANNTTSGCCHLSELELERIPPSRLLSQRLWLNTPFLYTTSLLSTAGQAANEGR